MWVKLNFFIKDIHLLIVLHHRYPSVVTVSLTLKRKFYIVWHINLVTDHFLSWERHKVVLLPCESYLDLGSPKYSRRMVVTGCYIAFVYMPFLLTKTLKKYRATNYNWSKSDNKFWKKVLWGLSYPNIFAT